MTRSEAMRLVHRHGGRMVRTVSRRPTILVVGREGWPLVSNGRVTQKLRSARSMVEQGHPIRILAEDEFLIWLQSSRGNDPVTRRCDLRQLTTLLALSSGRVRTWLRYGLIKPSETINGIDYFDFGQVAGAKSLCELAARGVPLARLRRSLEQLRDWLGVEPPLSQLSILEKEGRLLYRLENGQLAEPTGQLHLDFLDGSEDRPAVQFDNQQVRDDWFDYAYWLEQRGQLDEACAAYREGILREGPTVEGCFNLANVLHALGHDESAAERFRQVIELQPHHCDAWNNLATVLAQLGHQDDALTAYERALAINPNCAAAHYNLADALTDLGRQNDAKSHWIAYLRQEPSGAWADYARSQLQEQG